MDLEIAPFSLKKSIEDTALLMSSRARERGLELIVRTQPDLRSEFEGDDGRIRQVLTNLISNAIKFTHDGYVMVGLTGEDMGDLVSVKIEITDTGIGIADDKLESIFQSFQQADISTTRHYGGTGLGLSISKLLIEAMGGEIGISSEVGQGSTFWIRLSLPKCGDAQIENLDTPANGQRILIVDDIAVNRTIASELLMAWNYRTETVDSGKDALRIMRRAASSGDPFDLVLSDYLMPDMDGKMLAQNILKDALVRHTPIIVLSSVDEDRHRKALLDIGINDFILKPARSAVLRQSINTALEEGALAESKSAEIEEVVNTQLQKLNVTDDRCRVLLAEDNEVNRMVVTHFLDPNKYELTYAENGREAVERFNQSGPFDVILMDVSMPELDGYEATLEIRKIEQENALEKTNIICLSAHAMAAEVQRSIDVGMDDFLAKPVGKDQLEEKIEKWRAPSRSPIEVSA